MSDGPQWHSIRPWRPTLSLSVREITSVSATFILSSPLAALDARSTEASLASLGLSAEDDARDRVSSRHDSSRTQIVSDVLSKGLSVKVNGTPWQRVLMKIDDEADEAVIILFGLMPGRQYDVELGIVPTESTLRSQITTGPMHARTDADGPEVSGNSEASPPEQRLPIAAATSISNGTAQPISSPSSHTNGAPHGSQLATPPAPPISLEEQRLQLTHTLNLLTSEHSSLMSSLKTARRESQKADAALRSEIEALKRASDRHATGEQRARQKVRALQEAVRQTLGAVEDIEALIGDIEAALPGLQHKKEEVEKEWEQVNAEANAAKARREEAEAREKRRVEAMQAEMTGLGNRLERLNVRRDKLEGEGGVIADLEERLKQLESERERFENDPYGFADEAGMEESPSTSRGGAEPEGRGNASGGGLLPLEQRTQTHDHRGHQPHARKRHSHPAQQLHQQTPRQAPVGRQDPIQRPTHSTRLSLPGHLAAGPGVIHLSPHSHAQAHPVQGRPAGRTHAAPGGSPSSISSSSTSSPSLATMHPTGSNLSSRAPPFEPSGLVSRIPVKSDLNPGSSPFSPRTSAAAGGSSVQAASRADPPGKRAAGRPS